MTTNIRFERMMNYLTETYRFEEHPSCVKWLPYHTRWRSLKIQQTNSSKFKDQYLKDEKSFENLKSSLQ
mgnify:CR=1 FL=1